MPDFEREARLWNAGYRHVAGVDEAGRGCLAGPVVAAAVILPADADLPGLDDSKKLLPERRAALFPEIRRQAVGVGVGICSPEEIDRLNILWAALEAMRRAAEALTPPPQYVLIDGDRCFADCPWPAEPLVRGDGRSRSIAAASVVAKVTRDRLMERLHEAYPQYGWAAHKGYPTPAHYAALAAYGPCVHHRRSFRLIR